MSKYKPNFTPSKVEDHHDYVVYRDVRIPMRDGVELSANIYFPSKDGVVDFSKKYPILMNRSGYMGALAGELAASPSHILYFAVEEGYVFVINASRGTYLSEGGEVRPLMDEGWGEHKDGVDTVNWLVQQPWSNGKVATCGISWVGNTQYSIWLTEDVPGLVTSAIECPAMNSFGGGWIYKDEFLDLYTCLSWSFMQIADQCKYKHLPQDTISAILEDNEKLGNPVFDWTVFKNLDYSRLQREYGLENIPVLRHIPFYQRWLANRDNPDFFSYNDTSTRKHDAKRPLLFMSSWNDLFKENALSGYTRMVADAPTEEIAKAHRLVVSPWPHVYNPLLRDFPEAATDRRTLIMEWVQQQVNGIPSKFFQENPVTLFVQGENRWRGEQSWPLPDAEIKKLYLSSVSPANTMLGGGVLSESIPAKDQAPDRYVSDPKNPVVADGGNSMVGGHADQRPAEMRPDVLCYTTEALEEDVEVTGYVKATLYAATSATDTDFFMKLVDVCPDGNCYRILTGGRRGRYLKNGRRNPTALIPGEINKYEINLHATSYVFKKGHKIRVEICSTDSKNYDINPNAFINLNTATQDDYVEATQTIYHDEDHPTVIELPVIPASHQGNWIEEWPFHASITGFDTQYESLVPRIANTPVLRKGSDIPATTSQENSRAGEIQKKEGAYNLC